MNLHMNALTTAGAVTALITTMLLTTATARDVGVQRIVVPADERGTDLDVLVWYPASSGGEPIMLGENVFFEGTQAMQDAPISAGEFPIVLLSHGAGLAGRAEAMSWIAKPLAEEGFVVAAPTHPGNTGPDRSAAETMKLWLRPSDLSVTLDAIESDATLRSSVHADKVGVLGLSMGGNTALLIAGARVDPNLLASYCDTDNLNASLCDWVQLSGVDLHAMDRDSVARDNKDERIRFVMAIDPAPADIFSTETFSGISIPTALVNLGKEGDIPATAQASTIADAIPGASYEVIENASHFSMFAICKQGAAEIAKGEGIEDPICADGSGRSRNAIHAQLIELVTTAFSRELN